MIKQKFYNYIFGITLATFFVVLIFVANSLSISYNESLNVLVNKSVLSYITKSSTYFFGNNDISIRLPFIILYVFSVILMYLLTKDYFKKEIDRLFNILIFMFLPGVVSASLLINSSIVVIFCTLVYLYYYKLYSKHNYYLLFFFLFVDNSFAVFFLALFFYSLNKKENKLLIISLILFALSMYIYGFESTGKPRSYLLDTFGIYASIFSPLIFLYFFYSLYRVGIKGTHSIYWYISITAMIFSLLFSFRQKIYIEDFAPYVVISLPIMLKLFMHSLRVRLPEFRRIHYNIVKLSLFFLFINTFLLLYNKPLYLILDNPEKHFAYNYYFAKDIAKILKKNKINNIKTFDRKLQKRLEFYGIVKGNDYFVSLYDPIKYDQKFIIKYFNKDLLDIYVRKIKQ
ncbi:MAG: glycosyltransferase family 39 protein [Arcobacter sp.]|jgi:4-amino-4-deoxy-L-arabinose transferase-like glycosyltransferase|tara:strand:- start:714 stop:1913 length:1200 start_codon:yes stop_codon:yes gene_type:complete